MEVAKVTSQFVILLEQASIQYRRAQQYLVKPGRVIGCKVRAVGETLHTRRYYLPELRSGCAPVIAITNRGIEKLQPHISALMEAAAVIVQRAQQNLVKAGIAAGCKARQVGATVHARQYYLPELRSDYAAVIAITNRGIEKLQPHISALREAAAVIVQRAQQNVVKAGIAAGYKARQAGATVHARQYYLPEFRKCGAAAISGATGGIKKVGSLLYVPFEHGARYVQRAGDKATSMGREIADKPRRIRAARHTRENELRNFLATSIDAVVVMDDQHRFIAANTHALELFGVSEANIKNFTLDSFISKNQTPGFNGHGASFSSSEVKKGNCQIRRLNGNLRLADYELTANHLPFRHLCIFRNVSCKTTRLAKIAASPALQSR